MSESVEFLGAEFQVASKVGLMPLLRFAHIAQKGAVTDDMESLVAIYDMLRSVIAEEDWDRFQEHASTERADADDLLDCVKVAISVMTARPTQSSFDASDGQPLTETNSLGDSSSEVFSTRDLRTESKPAIRLDPRVLELVPISVAARGRASA